MAWLLLRRIEKEESNMFITRRDGRVVAVAWAAGILIWATSANAQVAGSSTIGVSKEEIKALALGWSAKRHLLDKPVYNEKKEKIGSIEDLIITPEQWVSYAIIGVGGFLGLGTHDV